MTIAPPAQAPARGPARSAAGRPGPVRAPGSGPPARRPAPARRPISPGDLVWRWLAGKPRPKPTGPDAPSPNVLIASTSLSILAAILIGFVAQVTLIGTLKHNRDQRVAYDDLRLTLAEGTAPVGPIDGKPLPFGTPLARVSIPAIGVKEVVLEGTTSGVLRSGVGHRRDTVLPGQAGTSILMGRRMAYGGPFSQLGELSAGDTIDVVSGQGAVQYKVLGSRVAGDLQPLPLPAGGSRITMITSGGSRFSPNGVLRVDADLVGPAFGATTPFFTGATLSREERLMATESGGLKGAVGWGILLSLAAVGTTWLRAQWGRWQAWLVAVPTLAYLGVTVADHAVRLLPNLL